MLGVECVEKKECPKCHRRIHPPCFKRHVDSCGSNIPKFVIPIEWKISNFLYQCGICQKKFSLMGMVSHYYRKHTQQGIDFVQKQKPWLNVIAKHPHGWNRGYTKKTNKSLEKLSNSLKARYKTEPGTFTGKSHSYKTLKQMRLSAIKYIESNSIDGSICPRAGKHENQFISEIQKYVNFPILRNQQIDGFFPDGYIKELNVIIEFNENFHYTSQYHIEHDLLKYKSYKDLNLIVFIVKECDWLNNSNFVIDNFKFIIMNVNQTNPKGELEC